MQRYFRNLRREPSVTAPTNVASPCPALLCFPRAGARQPRFAPISGVPMNNAALGRFIDGGKERSYIGRLRFRLAGAFAQSSNTRENATVSKRTVPGLACTFGG